MEAPHPPPSPGAAVPSAPAALRAEVDALYTPLEEAVAELHRRRRLFDGRTPGREWLPPEALEAPSCAFLSRYVATPNFETLRFLDLAWQSGLTPVLGEYHRDKWVTHNPIKKALAWLGVHRGRDRNGDPMVTYRTIVSDWNESQGKQLCEVRTFRGQSFIEFHHRLLGQALEGTPPPVLLDWSDTYARAGGSPACYYPSLLSAFIAGGILFEDFLIDDREAAFTRDIILPAFETVTTRFGLKPLIVRLTSPEEEESPHWFWYHAGLEPVLFDSTPTMCSKEKL